jgi:hypothetical protein
LTQAQNGNAPAARELRAWLAEYPPTDDAISTEDLDRQTRDRLLARLLAELEEEDASPDIA